MTTHASGQQDELDEKKVAELLDTFPANTVVFCRIEKGEKSYHILCADDTRQLPKGKEVLIS